MSKIISKHNGISTEHELPDQPLMVIVHQPEIRVDVPEAGLEINSRKTIKCMEDMSQRAWEHISTGPLFCHFWNILYKDRMKLPKTIKSLIEDYDLGVIHSCGLIVMLVESRFACIDKVFIRTPEDHMHPDTQQKIMSVINEIAKLPSGTAIPEVIELDSKFKLVDETTEEIKNEEG